MFIFILYKSAKKKLSLCCQLTHFLLLQQIDEMLAGALTQEDEDAVLAELEAITQVGVKLHV